MKLSPTRLTLIIFVSTSTAAVSWLSGRFPHRRGQRREQNAKMVFINELPFAMKAWLSAR